MISNCVQLQFGTAFLQVISKCDLVDVEALKQLVDEQYNGESPFYKAVDRLKQEISAPVCYLEVDDEDAMGNLQFQLDTILHYEE